MTLLEILSKHSPKLQSSGQIRMECPFRDRHPDGSGKYSFFISPDIGAYHCFSCGARGSAVKLLTKHFDIPYFEAVGIVKLTEYKKKKKDFELDIMWDIVPPKSFLDRGYTKETLKHFKLGVSTEDGSIIIPFYWGRELKGYQKRWDTSEGRIVKNSPDFSKGEYLYNYDTSFDYTVGVEGYSDVMRLFQFGYNATGLLGAYMSKWQAEKMSKFKKVYLAYDNDLAGRRVTELAYHRLKNLTEVLFIPYPTKDPGECGRRAWTSAFNSATNYIEYTMEMSLHWEGYLDMKSEIISQLSSER